MKGFGFRKPQSKKRYSRLNTGFSVLIGLAFVIFSISARIQNIVVASPKESLFEQNMGELALYISTYDNRASSVLLSLQRIIQGYKNPDFLKTYQADIENVLQYMSNNPSAFSQLGLQEYKPFLDLLVGLSAKKDDLFSLVGKEKPQTYIVVLQNAAEKRPNGGFFGSFIKITIADAKITELKIIDSYVPGILKPTVSLQAPERSKTFLSNEDTITFLASNKFGFTDMDGKNIKRLYDLTYEDDIRGVIFVNSDLFADLIPGFQEQLREWQFKNAAIDLIRGEALPNKKELYFNGVNDLLKKRQNDFIKAIIKNFHLVQENRYLQAYLVRTSKEFPTLLQQNGLQTVFNQDSIYLWDYNSSFNKIDTFITKTTSIFDTAGRLVKESTQDVVSIKDLPTGKYTMYVQYSLNIPASYFTFIENLRKQFDITLQVREKHILSLYPERSTRGVIYAPQNITFGPVEGPTKTDSLFETPFSHNAFYILENTTNNSIKEIVIPFVKK